MKAIYLKETTSWLFVLVALVAFTWAALDPYRALLFSPIVFGAPHALSDVWYLLVRDSGVPAQVRTGLAIVSVFVLSGAFLLLVGVAVPPVAQSVLLVGLLALPLALAAPVHKVLGLWLIVAAIAFVLLATSFPLQGIVALLHNVIALVFLFALALPKWRAGGIGLAAGSVIVLLAIGMGVSFAGTSVFLSSLNSPRWSPFLSLVLGYKGGVAGAILFSYAFLQLLHFSVWIGFIPALRGDLKISNVTRSLGFGLPLLGGLVLVVAIFAAPLAAVMDPLKARQAYLTLVSFHGWMEIAWLLAHSAQLMQSGQFSMRRTFVFDEMHPATVG